MSTLSSPPRPVGSGVARAAAPADTGTLLWQWYASLDERGVAEARRCLLSGTCSRALLESLRRVLPPGVASRRGLDDPHATNPGDPLGARLQTLLRQQLLTGPPAPALLPAAGA
ncbi:hypothetical protein [Kineococcus aurantiacus]|uniref:Uncharacterized protein n=1 Tax=Kineococcus aurantiacus TaxID=37633 RepID=A0A7Y9DL81_9ACTN|nr:hypothetical protein [Kineococcus aurantiacus]NYD22575.1 hypothetical protein [Kineococcus aurantiacus]